MVASGPSLTEADTDLLRPHVDFCIAVNRSVEHAPWADVLYFADDRFYSNYFEDLIAPFEGRLVSQGCKAAGVERWRARNWLDNGGNSGSQAVEWAVDAGWRNIALIGFDFQHTHGKKHFHPDHPDPMPNAKGVMTWRKKMHKTIAPQLRHKGVFVLNLSRRTALTCFKMVTPETFVEKYACR